MNFSTFLFFASDVFASASELCSTTTNEREKKTNARPSTVRERERATVESTQRKDTPHSILYTTNGPSRLALSFLFFQKKNIPFQRPLHMRVASKKCQRFVEVNQNILTINKLTKYTIFTYTLDPRYCRAHCEKSKKKSLIFCLMNKDNTNA